MNFLGNLLLLIALIIYFSVLSMVYGNHSRSGDSGVGYAFSMLIANAGFIICIGLITLIIYNKGGFSWVNPLWNISMGWWVFGAFVLAMTGNFFFSFGEGNSALPQMLNQLFKFVLPGLLPMLILLGAAILLNESWQSAVPSIVYKLAANIAVGSGLLVIALFVFGQFKQAAELQKEEDNRKDNSFYDSMNQIDAVDVNNGIWSLLIYTDKNQHPEIREKALAKLKTRSDWEQELLRLLNSDSAPEAITFLASNDVTDKAIFSQALIQGILNQSKLIRENIRQCRDKYDLYEDKFCWEVERIILSVDRFVYLNVDYQPALQELYKSLDEPTNFKKPKLRAKSILNKWIENH